MALKTIVESLDDVPESIRDEYTEQDGKFVLQLEGGFTTQDRDKLQRALAKEREEHKTAREKLRSFGDYTPEKLEEIVATKEELELKIETLGAEDDEERNKKIEELAERRAQAKIRPLERQLKSVQGEFQEVLGERDSLVQEKRRSKIVSAVTNPTLLKEVGIVPDAVEDIELWALHHFELDDDGNVVSKDSLGTPGLAPKDVLVDLKTEGHRRHWFGATRGAGASGGRHGDDFADNPFEGGPGSPKFNLTKIGQVVSRNPQLAARMAKAASSKDYDALQFLPKELRAQ